MAQGADTSKLLAFLQTPAAQQLIHEGFAQYPETVFKPCPTLVSKSPTLALSKRVTFGPDDLPAEGTWKLIYPMSGCGNDTNFNIYFFATPGRKIAAAAGLPGTTHADLQLQRDSLLYAHTAATAAAKDCKKFDVKNTKFEGFGNSESPASAPAPNSRPGPWWEAWTLIGCNTTVDVELDFVPDATGTTIAAPLRKAKLRQPATP